MRASKLIFRWLCLCGLLLQLVSCASSPPAPVVDRTPAKPSQADSKAQTSTSTSKPTTSKISDWRPDTYIVKKGDNLLRISLELGYYYKEIAQANNISAPYQIKVGQVLQLKALKDKALLESKPTTTSTANANKEANVEDVVITPIGTEPETTVATTSVVQPVIIAITEPKAIREPYSDEALRNPLPVPKIVLENTEIAKVDTTDTTPSNEKVSPNTQTSSATNTTAKSEAKPAEFNEETGWAWPTKGKVIANFNEASNKGIDIAGTLGQAITAAAPGKVIYSGSDLRGYGKLVIIKHNANYLSVYAHNNHILVKEGQTIARGQKIAEMGSTDSNKVKLHFEIRRQGKSVDPSKYLQASVATN
ncbi:MAG TPA: peptidoglycan DD-metalloendopeptidase family protein [Methylotenera sp.]|nr:peptidoglycan DD-metalloendopeptidase family protein [Methylotenera sp.]HPH05235.1 peptidoglycan DD-metalloendopeptidase family protein [Methylotenera sp.]HPN00137.1 peptidoglycan DD-metalloendopeptidase family protein [Methylotenera sp.]